MKKEKVLFIGMTNNIGGIEKYLINVYRNINKEKFDTKFLVFSNSRPCFYEEIKNDLIYITHRRENYFKFLKELKKIYLDNHFSIIHVNIVDFSYFEVITFAKKYTNAKVIIHSHIAQFKLPSLKTKILNYIGLNMVKKYDDTLVKTACSTVAGQYMFKSFKNKKFTVLNNGVNIEEFKYNEKSRNKIRKELGIDNNTILLGNVGRMVYQKNQEYLLEIMKKLDNNYKLLIIGKGPLKNDLLNKTKEYGLEDNIIYLQDISNVYDYLSAMDIFLLPSHFEGLAICLVEAQASGLRCVAAKQIKAEEINISKNITYVSLDDLEKWLDTIKRIDYKNRSVSLEEFRTNYGIENTVKYLEEFYTRVIGDDKSDE